MRKINYIIMLFLLLITLLAGCAGNDELSIKICGYSDSIPENPHKLEYKDWDKDAFVDSKIDKNITFTVGNIEVKGNYIETEKRFSEFYETHKYKDENNRYFSLTEEGSLCTYFFGNNPSKNDNNQTYTEAECIDIASDFINSITDVSKYTITTVFDESRKMYTVSFVKYVDGFMCADQADIMIDDTGYIYSFSSTMLGKIPSDAQTTFDQEIIQKKLLTRLDDEYSKAKKAYEVVNYKDFNYMLTIDDNGKYALICTVDVECINHYGEYSAIKNELIRFLIQ